MADDKPISLHDDISAAWDQVEQGQAAPVSETPVVETPAPPPAEGDRPRDEQGRFAKATETPTPAPVPPDAGKPETAGQAVQPTPAVSAVAAVPSAPPPGWSIAAKAEFQNLPPPVQEAIAKRETEISEGFARYQGLNPFIDMARNAGSTLPEVVQRYVAAENLLTEDFGQGILGLCQHYNVDPAQLGQWLNGGQQQQGEGQQPDPTFAPVLNQLSAVEQRLAKFEQEQEQRVTEGVQTELQQFQAEPGHQYFENVRKAMGQLITMQPGLSLKDAYDQACWANPEIRALLIKQQSAANQDEARRKADSARNGARSLPTGSPIPGANSGIQPKETLRAEIEAAFDQHIV